MMFVCGAEIGRIGNIFYVVDPMAVCDTAEAAVLKNKELHRSFGYAIYAVEAAPVKHVVRIHGMRAGSKTTGLRIIKKECHAFEHPAWVAI